MSARSREIQVFSMSFLDVLSCALGGVLLLLFTTSPEPLAPVEQPPVAPAPAAPTPESDTGLIVSIALAARIDWDKPVDIDLWVKDPGSSGSGDFVYYKDPRSRYGFLMRDAQSETDGQWEIYCTVDPHPGVYELYAHYYSQSSEPVNVKLSVQLFPGEPSRRQEFEVNATLLRSQQSGTPGKLLGKFRLVTAGQDYRLEQISP